MTKYMRTEVYVNAYDLANKIEQLQYAGVHFRVKPFTYNGERLSLIEWDDEALEKFYEEEIDKDMSVF